MSYFYNDITVKEEISISKLITKGFTRNKVEVSPFALYRVNFKLDDNKIVLISGDDIIQTLTYEKFIEDYLYHEDYSLTKENNDFILNGSYYFTSLGIVSSDDFFLSEDIQERYTQGIKKKDLEINSIYFSNKGKEYLYLGSFESLDIVRKSNTLKKEIGKSEDYLYDIDKKELVKKNSIKLVKFEKENKEILNIDLFFLSRDLRKEFSFYQNIQTKIEGLTFSGFNYNDLNYFLRGYSNEIEEFNEFIDSDNEVLVLKLKDKKKEKRNDSGKIVHEEMMQTSDGRTIVRRRYIDTYGRISESVLYG